MSEPKWRCDRCKEAYASEIPMRGPYGTERICDSCEAKRTSITDAEYRDIIAGIESGAVTLVPEEPPANIWAGDVIYAASNGWRVEVFNDCGEWDYFNAFQAADDRRVEYHDFPEFVKDYRPDSDVELRAYGRFQ